MDESGYEPNKLKRLLNTSWPLFRAFRVRVSASWTIVVWPGVLAIPLSKSLPVGEALGWGAALTIALFTTVWAHEMGHIWMGRRCGIETETMTLRGLGGLAHLGTPAESPRDEILINLAGPATHLFWIAALFPLMAWLRPTQADATWFHMLSGVAWLQVSMLVFNLLPVYPMDGGKVARAALASRIHANRASYIVANAGFVGNGAFVIVGALACFELIELPVGRFGFFLAWIGLEGINACRQLRMEAKYADVYGDRDPFQKTLLASQAALRDADRGDKEDRAARRSAQEERRRLEETTDRLLDRINEVGGIDKLSPGERKELERASRALAEKE